MGCCVLLSVLLSINIYKCVVMSKVSVIIPIFNVEPYIERCTRSLMEQTLDDIEYIFVNDATPDASMDVLNRTLADYPHRLKSVKIIEHEFNKGLPAARQTGLAVATGDYIIHCDSDDFVEREMYRLLYQKAVSEDLDIVISGYYEGANGEWQRFLGRGPSMDLVINLFENKCSVWNKLVRSTIAKDPSIIHPTENMAEDLALIMQYVPYIKKIGYLTESLYYYDRHSTSILGNRSPEALLTKQLQFVKNVDIAVASLQKNGLYEKYEDYILHEYVYVKNYILPALPFTKSYKQWRDTYREVNSKVLFSRMFTIREKLNFVVTYLGLYPLYYRATHRKRLV